MKIEQLELKIFRSLDDLKNYIKKNFKVVEMGVIEQDDDDDYDLKIDELAFFDEEYDYSVYYMSDKSGRITVTETSKTPY